MSLRSLPLAALLFAAFAAADAFMSYWFNTSATKLCAVDMPHCFYVPKVDPRIDTSKTLVVVTYRCHIGVCDVADPVGEYSMLAYITVSPFLPWHIIDIPKPGLLTSPMSFMAGPAGSRQQTPSSPYAACGKTYAYAYYASASGAYNITPFMPPLYFVDLSTCREYRIAAAAPAVVNITTGWFSLYIAEMLPDTRGIYLHDYAWILNGTSHLYRTYFHHYLVPLGSGVYTGGGGAASLVMLRWGLDGPQGYDVLGSPALGHPPYFSAVFYNIGPTYGDGVLHAYSFSPPQSSAVSVAYISDGAAGYAAVDASLSPARSSYFMFTSFHRRYAVAEVAVQDGQHIYTTRGVACPAVWPATHLLYVMSMPENAAEVELCNNSTAPIIAALFYQYGFGFIRERWYFFADKIEPGKCARLRWAAYILPRPVLQVYTSELDFCTERPILGTDAYSPGWRHFYLPDNTVVPAAPASPDHDYADAWRQVLNQLGEVYTSWWDSFKRWHANATSNFTEFLKSQPRFAGVIRMDSSSSAWLRTTLQELQKWQAVGAPGSFAPVSLPPVPAAIAPAAAAAVAVAWAASRRDDDVAAAAAVAGIALALFGILMTLIYGAESLTLVALGVIVAAAAAAWRRIS